MDDPSRYVNCPWCAMPWRTEGIPGSFVLGVQLRGVYDGVCYWQCPSCEARFHRFADTTYRDKVEREWKAFDDTLGIYREEGVGRGGSFGSSQQPG